MTSIEFYRSKGSLYKTADVAANHSNDNNDTRMKNMRLSMLHFDATVSNVCAKNTHVDATASFGTKSASFPNDPTTRNNHPFCFIKVRIFSINFIFEQLCTPFDAGASKMCAKNTHFDAHAYFCVKVCLFGATKNTHFDALFAS
jgi:hypothetical protein